MYRDVLTADAVPMLYQTEPESLIPDAAADAEEKNSVVYRSSCDTDSCFHFY